MPQLDLGEARRITDASEKKYNLPAGTLFKVSGIESSFNNNAVSPKGAKGAFQFTDATAKAYGVDVTNFASGADGAGRYFQDNLKKYGGSMDMAIADYNGGPRAAAALAKGKPWAETTDYLKKFGGDKQPNPPIPQFAAGGASPEGLPPSAGTLARRSRDEEAQYGGFLNSVGNIPKAAGLGFELDNSVYNYVKNKAIERIDPDFQRTEDYAKKLLEGIPQENWGYILQGQSAQEDSDRRARTFEALGKEAELAKMGVTGFVARMGGSLLDLPTLMAFVPGMAGEGLMTAGARVGNAVRSGLVAGATNASYESASYGNRPLGTYQDIYFAAAMGVGLGALAGGFATGAPLAAENRALANFGMNEARTLQRGELSEVGSLTAAGQAATGRVHSDDLLRDAGVSRGPNESGLQNVGSDPSRSKANIGVDSSDLPAATYADMKLLKTSVPTDITHITGAREALKGAFGTDILEGLEGSGHIKFINSQSDLPASLRSDKGVNAFYDQMTDTTFLMADRLNKDNVRGIVMHDVGVHQGLERVVGIEVYNRMLATVDELAASGDASAVRALDRASQSKTTDFLKAEEKLAYYMEHASGKVQGVFREALAAVKAFLIKRLGVNVDLNEKDMIALVQGSVRRIARDKEFGSHNANFPYVWSGGAVKGIQKFSTDFVGTGEGNISQGFGLYTTSSKFIGDWYRQKESMLRGMKGEDGGLYQLKVNNASIGQFLRWDSASQSKEVQAALKAAGIDPMGKTGKEIYLALMEKADGATPLARGKQASAYLDSIGVKGSVYATGASRKKAIKSDNFVIYNENNLEVSVRYSEGGDTLVGGKGVPEEDVRAANDAGLSPVFGWGLGMEDRTQGAGLPQPVRAEAGMLIGTTKGYKDHSVVKANAWGQTTMLAESMIAQVKKKTDSAFERYFKETGRRSAEQGKTFEDFGEEVSNYVRGVDKEYHKEVVAAGEAVRAGYAMELEHINNPSLFYGGKSKGLTETILKDVETGVETIEGTLKKDPNHLPRKHDSTKTIGLINQFDRETVENWWKGAYQEGRPDISDAKATKWAGWYLKTVEDAYGNAAQDMLVGDMMRGMDKNSLKESMMRNGGYSEEDAWAVIRDMFPTKSTDKGALSSSLKHRNTINEKYTEVWKTKDGQNITVSLNDFTHSNAITNFEMQARRTAGNVALAHHAGIYKVTDIQQRIIAATENQFGKDSLPTSVVKQHRDDLQFLYDRVQGLPQEHFSGLNKSLEMWRSFNVIRLMGGAVWNQLTEMSQIVGSMGWKAMAQAIPELNSLRRNIQTGKAPNDILEHLENTIGGAGSEFVQRMEFKLSDDWVRNKGDTLMNRRLDKLDTKLKQFAKGVLDYTGMTPLMIQQKRIHAIALVNHFVNDANGSVPSTFLTKDRLAWMGMDVDSFKAVQESLKKYSSPSKGEYSATNKLDFDKWVKESPETHARFMEAIHRETRRVVQENDLASMVPIMGTTLGQTMFQFMNFSMHGWNKSLMFAMNHRDYSTLSTVLHGGLIGSLAYMGRTMLNSVGMDPAEKEKLMAERMSVKQIVANSLGRTAQASLLPSLYDSTAGNLTGPMFSGMRTTSDISSLASNPTLGAVNSTLSLLKIGKNAVSGDSQTTQQDMKQWSKLLPLNNVAPVSTLLNAMAADYPTSAKQE